MTQQVVRARMAFPNGDTHSDMASIDIYMEATGTDTTLPFSGAGDTPQGVLAKFFNNVYTLHSMSAYLASSVSRGGGLIPVTWTDITGHLDGSPAGSPFRTDFFTADTVSFAQDCPPACAAVVGYRRGYGTDLEHGSSASLPSTESAIDQGAPATHTGITRPRARDRGRFYYGPLNLQAIAPAGGVLSSTFRADLTPALVDLFTEHNPGSHDQFSVVQWSRRNASVSAIGFYFIGEAVGYVRKRADEDLARVHTWVSV